MDKYNTAFKLFALLESLLLDLAQIRTICREFWIYTQSNLILSVLVSTLIDRFSQIKQGYLSTAEGFNSNCFILGKSFTIVITQFLGSTTFLTITFFTMSRHLYGNHFFYLWLPSFTIVLGTYFTIFVTQLLVSSAFLNIALGMMSRHLYGIHFRYLWLTFFAFLSITNFLRSMSLFGDHFIYLWLSYCLCRGWLLYITSFNWRSFSILFFLLSSFLRMSCLLLFIAFIRTHGTRGLSYRSHIFISRGEMYYCYLSCACTDMTIIEEIWID